MPKLQRAKTVACGLLRWDRCCIIVVSHWSKPAGQNMASLLVVVGFRTSHSMPKEESHVIFSKNLPLKAVTPSPGGRGSNTVNSVPLLLRRLRVEGVKLLVRQRADARHLGGVDDREVLHPEEDPRGVVPDLLGNVAVELFALLGVALFLGGVDPHVNLGMGVKSGR